MGVSALGTALTLTLTLAVGFASSAGSDRPYAEQSPRDTSALSVHEGSDSTLEEEAGRARALEQAVLRIGTSGDYAPFSTRTDSPGEGEPSYQGFDIDVARAFAIDRGLRIEWVPFAWPELLVGLREKRFDLAMSGVTVRPERSLEGRFSVPVMTSGAVLLVSDSAMEAGDAGRSVEEQVRALDRPQVRVSVNAGGHLERVTRARLPHAGIQAFADNDAVRRALLQGNVDVAVSDTLEAPVWLEGMRSIRLIGPLTEDRKAYLVDPDRDELSRDLDAWLVAREREGMLADLRRRHFPGVTAPDTAEPLHALLAAIVERLALMPWVAEAKRAGGRPVEDLAQEVRVIDAALAGVVKASQLGSTPPLDAAAVRAFYRAQIEAAKVIQRSVLAGPTAADVHVVDLVAVLRPALMRIGSRMAQLLVEVSQIEDRRHWRRRVGEELAAAHLPRASVEAIADAILGLRAGSDGRKAAAKAAKSSTHRHPGNAGWASRELRVQRDEQDGALVDLAGEA